MRSIGITSDRRAIDSVLLSLLAHALFCALCLLLMHARATHTSAPPIWVQLEPPKNPSNTNKKDLEDSRRIVQSNVGQISKEAAPKSFLGEKTRIVDRETVNKDKKIVVGKPGSPAKVLTQVKPLDKPQTKNQPKPKGETKAEQKLAMANLGLAILPDARRKGATEDLAKDEPEWANIGSQPQDYVDGIKQSDRTALNTREYLYFGYHQRIRQRLETQWTRLLREVLLKFYRGGRQLANDTEYTTRLMVILNDRGEITKIKVLGMSGTQELDDVAVEAFNKAGPFPNPPKGLVKNGIVEVPWEMKLRS